MPATLATRNRRPAPPAHRALLALFRAADRVKGVVSVVIEPHGVTLQQYNVLRILRGAEPEGLPTLAIAERMIERAPGITRMIDRLERLGLVIRERRADDRRCVHCRITRTGLELLAELDRPVDAADRRAFSALTAAELDRLILLLEKVRVIPAPG
jgi:DNA-binding MarR family transcriptional regulator